MTADVDRLVRLAEDDSTAAERLRVLLDDLLRTSPGIGSAVALGLLAREPRVKPSRRLLIDPSDAAFCRWERRVAAAAALLSSSSARVVRHELGEEFGESPDLEREARAQITGATGVT